MQILVKIIAVAAAAWFLIGLMLYLFQGRMVFLANMPGRALEASPDDIGLRYENLELPTSDGERLHAWYVPAPGARGVVLFFHGNAGNISHRLDSIAIFNQLGLDVMIIDYRGYGESTGRPSEKGTYLDAQAAWDYLRDERGVSPARIVIFGRSLGGAVGAWLGVMQGAVALLAVALAGVITALCWYLAHRDHRERFGQAMPYGAAICIGVCTAAAVALFWPHAT